MGSRLAPLDRTSVIEEPLFRLRCIDCGYGASCRTIPDRCPMCGRSRWSADQSDIAARRPNRQMTQI